MLYVVLATFAAGMATEYFLGNRWIGFFAVGVPACLYFFYLDYQKRAAAKKKKKKSVPNVKNVNNSINDKKNALDNAFFLFFTVIIKYYPQRVFRRQTGTKLTAAILQCAVVIAAAGKK